MGFEPNYIGGLIGPAGGGKSISLARLCIEQMLAGKKVWSNMEVKTGPAILNRKYYYHYKIRYCETIPLDMTLLYMLDEELAKGTVAIDEMGYYADSRLSGSTKNRLINACIRQVRKRQLNFFYTAFDFGRVDGRLRDETDFIITCEDNAYKPWGKENNIAGGLSILQRLYDISGKMTGKRQDFFSPDKVPYDVREFLGRPYWECFDTRATVSLEEAFSGVQLDLQKTRISNRNEITDGIIAKEIAIHTKMAELEAKGIYEVTPSDYAKIVIELGLPNNNTTRAKFRSRGLIYHPEAQSYHLEMERQGETVLA